MIDYLVGKITELSPTYAIVEVNNIGYFVNISLWTYDQLRSKKQVKIYVRLIVRDDSLVLYGFSSKDERDLFDLLITVSGVGAATARLMLSSLSPDQVRMAIIQGDVQLIKSIKGIGLKTAQRIIVDLRDKLSAQKQPAVLPQVANKVQQEAIEALVTLGFSKKTVEKVVGKIIRSNPEITVEQLIKESFKFLT